jgi:hypothetical protein
MRFGLLVALVFSLSCGDGRSTSPAAPTGPPPPPILPRGTVTDATGDAATCCPVIAVAPDLVSGGITITDGGTAILSVRFSPGTFDPNTTTVGFLLDTDQNAASGGDFTGMGLEYIVDFGSEYFSGFAFILRYEGFGEYGPYVPAAPVSIVNNGMEVALPLSLLGGDDGRMNFRVYVQTQVSEDGFTTILDYMPDRGLAAARCQ